MGSRNIHTDPEANPINVRRNLGIKKGHNPKAMGLFLEAYGTCKGTELATILRNVIISSIGAGNENQSKGYSGNSWGYNFPWATTAKTFAAGVPTVVATAFVV
ncbi:MAG: hypothetical protein IPN88_11765 [Bacteroidetes bacterium]|nr:hypothetical protein [Bacteroidota bacterium]